MNRQDYDAIARILWESDDIPEAMADYLAQISLRCPECGATNWGEIDSGDSTQDCLTCGIWVERDHSNFIPFDREAFIRQCYGGT